VTVTPSLARLTLAVLLVLTAVGAQPAAAAPVPPPPTLSGEQFLTNSVTTSGCTQALFFSFFTYSATGNASGPYPGKFSESGTVFLGQQNQTPPGGSLVPLGDILSWSADFTISSGVRVVTGTKSLLGPPPNPPFSGLLLGACADNVPGNCGAGCVVTKIRDAGGQLSYEAQIEVKTKGGCFIDDGTSLATVQDLVFAPPDDDVQSRSSFLETFTSNRSVVEKAKCKAKNPPPGT
jgi:hypothetical protein